MNCSFFILFYKNKHIIPVIKKIRKRRTKKCLLKFFLKNLRRHFVTITKHKMYVGGYLFRAGLIKQGICHDLSKYSPVEFIQSVLHYEGTRSPIDKEKEIKGYSEVWLHHKGRNRHHYEYWIDTKNNIPYGCKMPQKYFMEMVFDRVAAAKIYNGSNFTNDMPLNWFLKEKDGLIMHPQTKEDLEAVLKIFARKSNKKTIVRVVKEYLYIENQTRN